MRVWLWLLKYIPFLGKLAGIKGYALVGLIGLILGASGVHWIHNSLIARTDVRALTEANIALQASNAGLVEEYNKQDKNLVSLAKRLKAIDRKYNNLVDKLGEVEEYDDEAQEWINTIAPDAVDDFLREHEGRRGCQGSETEASGCTSVGL